LLSEAVFLSQAPTLHPIPTLALTQPLVICRLGVGRTQPASPDPDPDPDPDPKQPLVTSGLEDCLQFQRQTSMDVSGQCPVPLSSHPETVVTDADKEV